MRNVCIISSIAFRQIRDIIPTNTNELENFEIQYEFTADERLDRENGEVIIDEKIFQFRSDGFQNIENASENSNPPENHVHDLLMVAPAEDSPQNILYALNDDCLLAIFNELGTRDLYIAANTCQQFNGIAERAFKSKYTRQDFSPMDDLCTIWSKLSLYHVELFVRAFGTGVRTVNVAASSGSNLNKEIVLRMCVEHCPIIETLNLRGVHLNACIEKDIRCLLPRLKILTLDLIEPCALGDLFVGDWPLEKLEIDGLPDWDTVKIKMPKLIELYVLSTKKIFDTRDYITERFPKQCLSGNPQIRKLTFKNYCFRANVFDLLPAYLPCCKEIAFSFCRVDENERHKCTWTEWHKLNSITALQLYSFNIPTREIMTTLAMNKVPLKSLRIYIDETEADRFAFEHITPFKQLEKIIFDVFSLDININRLTRRLDNLSEVIMNCIVLNSEKMQTISKWLRQIERPLNFSIEIRARCMPAYIPRSEFDEITDLLRARPGIDFRLTLGKYVDCVCIIFITTYRIFALLKICLFPRIHRVPMTI